MTMEKKLDTLCAERLIEVLPQFNKLLHHEIRDRSAENFLSFPQYQVLKHLKHCQWSCTEMARRLQVTLPTVTSLIDGLEERGLVKRGFDPANRRSVPLSITPAGEELFDIINSQAVGIVSEVISSMDSEQQENLLESMQGLQEAMNNYAKRGELVRNPAGTGGKE